MNLTHNYHRHVFLINKTLAITNTICKRLFSLHATSLALPSQRALSLDFDDNLNMIEPRPNDDATLSAATEAGAAAAATASGHGFKFNELLMCRQSIGVKKRKGPKETYVCKMVQLEPNGIFRNKDISIFHEHIVSKSSLMTSGDDGGGGDQASKGRTDLSVSFSLMDVNVHFKRPTLYEYVALSDQRAVSSHFSIITLAPMLLELNKSSRLLECGTGAGSMTLFLSSHLGADTGMLHTFEQSEEKALYAKGKFLRWKSSYDLRASGGGLSAAPAASSEQVWPNNVKFGVGNICEARFVDNYVDYYDAIYLDMSDLSQAVLHLYKTLKVYGVIVVNAMHMTQILKVLNVIDRHGLALKCECVIEPANKFWELRKVQQRTTNQEQSVDTSSSIGSNSDSSELDWTCRLEDTRDERTKRGGIFFNYWPGFLLKLRRVE